MKVKNNNNNSSNA